MNVGWTTAAGLALLAVLFVDAFVTVLHASSGAGPYTSLQNRLLWRLARGAPSAPGRRLRLSLAAPTMALATPVAWIGFLTVGFALVYHPALETFGARPPLDVPRWVGALYYSGYVTSTLGLGDVTPSGAVWRLAAVAQSALGFGLFSAAITYVLSIYERHAADAGLALRVDNTFRESDLLEWGEAGSERRALARSLALDLAGELSAVNVAHQQYPILHYFHGAPEKAVVVQVGRLVEFLDQAPQEEARGAAQSLERGLRDFLDQMPFDTGGGDEELRERHRRLLRAHGYTAG